MSLSEFEAQVLEAEAEVQGIELPKVINAADWLRTEPDPPDQILEGIIDVGDKLAIIGSSKRRKSFFLLQFLVSLASGRAFLNWKIPKTRRIVHIQFEIQSKHYHWRVKRMALAMGITPGDIGDRLNIINARGLGLSGLTGIKKIESLIEPYHP